ncbi:MAG: hypothetical protein HQ500_06900 [Flavobacteriales bacterium]|nr:hypothetical protein [Flavobacteriales bacterium]
MHIVEKEITGAYTSLEGEDFFVINHFDRMPPFFMTIVSSSDHWLFLSSNGALSAGRRNPDNAVFPYYTDDKITDSAGQTGAKAIFRVREGDHAFLWEPFAEHYRGVYPTTSKLYKNREGNKIVFEKRNEQLGLTYRYGWMFSDRYGIVRRSQLINDSDRDLQVELLDGIMNVLPYGIDSNLQNFRSTLVDAYKRNELDTENGLGIFSLSSMVVDKAEPSEALKATTVWSAGLDQDAILLSTNQLGHFRRGGDIVQEEDIKATKGAYFIHKTLSLAPKAKKEWVIVSEVNQSAKEIESLRKDLQDKQAILAAVNADIAKDKEGLRKKIGMTDGIQLSNDRLSTGRHFSNVLFNIMRGGTFDDQYEIETKDFVAHVKRMNEEGYRTHRSTLSELPPKISYHQLRYFLTATQKKDLMRYYSEYLPLSFSRRHGDPSRPWNYFSIETRNALGEKSRNYEGNWRDIFQNWEALAFSYPEFTLGMISKFVNASTIDGYNPYRITRDGIDWEVIEPDDPWSYIGYWGDHQVIYLTKFLEFSVNYHPKRLRSLLAQKSFTYANVPYRIKGYDAITSNPKDTIDFDHDLDRKIGERVRKVGSDGKMIWTDKGKLLQVNLTEKLLVMILTKLYNFVPEAGIWLNTQRPEWNDANNALVGNGVSMVTLYYLRRLLSFCPTLFSDLEVNSYEINKPVVDLLDALNRGFQNYEECLTSGFSDQRRRHLMDDFGIAGEHYRTTAYAGFTGDKRTLSVDDILAFFTKANRFLEHAIDKNKRLDGLYHSYNLVSLSERSASVEHLYEMLEGQVAVLSAKYLPPEEALNVLHALKGSAMFRPDQYSYMLYPDRELAPFLEKNTIEPALVEGSALVEALLAKDDTSIIERDINGKLHFNGSFHNEKDLLHALNALDEKEFGATSRKDKKQLMEAFETVFDHRSFTGRSGTFYGYEGLGSIYWHMVSKLLLSAQENIIAANDHGADAGVIGQLVEHYYEIRAGIGVNKSPKLYGAFPTDAYSHTPKYAGAQQPGMTGQVKEDIINRWAELGVFVKEGRLAFQPIILRASEFLKEAATLSYYDHEGKVNKVEVPSGSMAFTYCQIPVVYSLGDDGRAEVHYADGSQHSYSDGRLNLNDSKDIFQRTGRVKAVTVFVKQTLS